MTHSEAYLVGLPVGRLAAAENNAPSISDYQLAQQAGQGEMEAFGELYQRYHRRVYSLCLRMTRNHAEAEDLTHDTFIQAFRHLASFRGEAAFTTWLHRLTVNQVLMHFRKRSIRMEQTIPNGETPIGVVGGAGNPHPSGEVDRLALEEALGRLAPGYRVAIILHDVEGYQHEEVTEMLGCSVGTSKSQLHKARLRLRQLLGQPNP